MLHRYAFCAVLALSLALAACSCDRITNLELAQAFRAAGLNYDAKTISDVFHKADRDGSGTIDFAEFRDLAARLAGRASASARPSPPAQDNAQTAALRAAFAKYDKDNSGR